MATMSDAKDATDKAGDDIPQIQPTYSSKISPEERKSELEADLQNGRIPDNQIKNVQAVLLDYEAGRERAQYYQDGEKLKSIEDFDHKKGALWIEVSHTRIYVYEMSNALML